MSCRTELSLELIKKIITDYKIPEIQRLVDNEHTISMVNDQIDEFAKYGTFSILQSFTVAYLKEDDIGYILDGQHRIAVFIELEKRGYNISNVRVPIVKYNVDNIGDVNEYFLKINKHSDIKPMGSLVDSERIFFQLMTDNFKPYLKQTERSTTYKRRVSSCNCPHISIPEFKENFNARNITDKLQKTNKSVKDLWNSILDVNSYLYSISNEQLDVTINKRFVDCKNKADKEGCNTCYLGVFRQFQWLDIALDSLINSKKISSFGAKYYTDSMKKITRGAVPSKLRNEIWKKMNINECDRGLCYTCNDELLYSDMICGHITAHALGGDSTFDNLMPICKKCNCDMGIMNLDEYKFLEKQRLEKQEKNI